MISSTNFLLGASLLVFSAASAAHGGGASAENWWTAWSFGLDLMLPLLLAAFIYTRGALHRRARSARVASGVQPVLFGLGLLVLFLSLQSPIDPLGERSFSMHQVQHLLLRSMAPLLLFLSSPHATLIAGLPSRVRHLLGQMSRVPALRVFFGVLAHPASATVLFIGSAYAWQYPPYFNAALLNDGIHYLMHVTMLLAGMLFWWRILDDRPSATAYGARIVMLWAATVANIGLGAYLTLKGGVLYPVYDDLGRLWVGGELDELLGGIIVWIPGSMMNLVGLLAVIRRWGHRDGRRRSAPRQAGHVPPAAIRGSAGASRATRPALRMALMLGLISGGIFLGFAAFIALALLR